MFACYNGFSLLKWHDDVDNSDIQGIDKLGTASLDGWIVTAAVSKKGLNR